MGFHHKCHRIIEAKRPDIVVVDTIKKETIITDDEIQEIQEYVIKNEKRSKNTAC